MFGVIDFDKKLPAKEVAAAAFKTNTGIIPFQSPSGRWHLYFNFSKECPVKLAHNAVKEYAEIFEKHIASKWSKKSPDFKFSLIEDQIGLYRNCLDETYRMFEKKNFHRNKSENFYRKFRRSIYALKNIKKGELLTNKNIKLLRPFNGLSPKYYNKILNKKSPFNILAESAVPKKILKNFKIK